MAAVWHVSKIILQVTWISLGAPCRHIYLFPSALKSLGGNDCDSQATKPVCWRLSLIEKLHILLKLRERKPQNTSKLYSYEILSHFLLSIACMRLLGKQSTSTLVSANYQDYMLKGVQQTLVGLAHACLLVACTWWWFCPKLHLETRNKCDAFCKTCLVTGKPPKGAELSLPVREPNCRPWAMLKFVMAIRVTVC